MISQSTVHVDFGNMYLTWDQSLHRLDTNPLCGVVLRLPSILHSVKLFIGAFIYWKLHLPDTDYKSGC